MSFVSAPQMLLPREESGPPCYLCGGSGAPTKPLSTLSKNFTQHALARSPSSDQVCESCLQALAGKPPDTLRMWSLLWREDGRYSQPSASGLAGPRVWLGNKADLRPIVETLVFPPDSSWVCCVADSGKLHTLPFAVVNSGRQWVVRLDRIDVEGSSAEFAHVLGRVARLVGQGFSRKSIREGEPTVYELVKFGLDFWKENSTEAVASSPLLELALLVTKKDHVDDTLRILEN